MVSRSKFFVLIICAAFCAAIGMAVYLRSPSSNELWWLLIIALALITAYVGFGAKLGRAAAPVPQAVAQAATAASGQLQLLVLDGFVTVPAGGVQELMHACTQGMRPALDSQLSDDNNFPVMAARVAGLDAIDLHEWWDGLGLQATLPQGSAWVAQLPEARARELRLLAQVLADAAASLEDKILALHEHAAGLTAVAQLPLVQVRLALSQGWAQGDLDALLTWCEVWLHRSAPALNFAVQVCSSEITDAAENARDALSDLWLDAQQTLAERAAQAVWLLAAAHSEISQEAVDRLAFAGRLYGPNRRDGRIVGEGAAAVALLAAAPDSAFVRAQQQFPAIAGAMPSAAGADHPLAQTVVSILENSKLAAARVGLLATDADHRSTLMQAAASLLAQQFPQLSLPKDCFMLGVPSGHTAQVSALTSWAVAAHFAAQQRSAALAINLTAQPRHVALFIPPAALAASDIAGEQAL